MENHNATEWFVLIALIRATSDQVLMLTGTEKRRAKQLLKDFDKSANRLNKQFEAMFDDDSIDESSDIIHNAINELRKEVSVIN
jgi:hypothetical protein